MFQPDLGRRLKICFKHYVAYWAVHGTTAADLSIACASLSSRPPITYSLLHMCVSACTMTFVPVTVD